MVVNSMEEYITKAFGQATITAAIVVGFVQFFKRGIPDKYFTPTMYPWLALVCGLLINLFVGYRLGMDWRDSAAIGAISALMAIGIFKYGKWENERDSSTK